MNNYEDWAQLVAKRLKGEADIIAAIEKDELENTAANEAFVRAVLEPFLPENFGVGSGRIVDAFGNQSDHIDIVVYNRDFPRIGMVGASEAYLYESVLAVFSVRAKFVRKTFFDSLNACASLARLETNIDKAVLVKLARKNGLKPGPNKTFVHEDPLRTARFELIGRPPAFVFGFSGIKHSYRQLQENVELWLQQREQDAIYTPMKALPAVIATQGCFAWRNAAPLALSNREMLGIGNDDAPVRLIVLQLLYLLNRRLNVTADGYGLKPSLNAYLSQFAAPTFELGVGHIAESSGAAGVGATDQGTISARYEPAKDHSKVKAEDTPKAEPLPESIGSDADVKLADEDVTSDKASPFASAPIPQANTPEPVVAETQTPPAEVVAETQTPPAEEAVVFDKPSPFTSAPVPPASTPEPAVAEAQTPAAEEAAVFDKPSPFTSAPVPPASTPEPAVAEAQVPAAGEAAVFDKPSPFASAPVPPVQTPAVAPAPAAPVAPTAAPAAPAPAAPTPAPAAPAPTATAAAPTTPAPAAPAPAATPAPVAPTPAAPLGSAPIPSMKPAAAKKQTPAPTPAVPPKPPVDFDLGLADDDSSAEPAGPGDDEYLNTVIIPPNAAASVKKAEGNTTDAFIARVKEQLTPEPAPRKGTDPLSSTVRQ